MAKLTLSSLLASFGSISKLNSNFTRIVNAFDNTLSRDGTEPNQMLAPLDMNSQRIINLPSPVGSNDPVRLLDIQSGLAFTSLVIPAQSGNAGKYLTTNGTVVSWGTVSISTDPTFNTLTVSGVSTLTGAVTMASNLTLGGSLNITGGISGSGLALSSTLTVAGAVSLGGAVTITSNNVSIGGTNFNVNNTKTGINTASPTHELHVVGSAKIEGAAFTPVITTTVASTTTVDTTLSNIFLLPMTANISTLNMSGPQGGQTINLILVQDGVGSRTIAWPANFKWSGGTVGTLSTGPNKVDFLVATWIPSAAIWAVALTKDFR